MLERLGRLPEATAAFDRAAELETNRALRAVFIRRASNGTQD
jgi:predicted RNA polymerase sigma factor